MAAIRLLALSSALLVLEVCASASPARRWGAPHSGEDLGTFLRSLELPLQVQQPGSEDKPHPADAFLSLLVSAHNIANKQDGALRSQEANDAHGPTNTVKDNDSHQPPQPAAEEVHTKLEQMAIDAIEKFRSRMNGSQLNLPPLDPFVFADYLYEVQNENINLNLNVKSMKAEGLSKFTVNKLKLYLVQRLAVLELTLPKFDTELIVDIANGSWVSPLKIPFFGDDKIRMSVGPITLATRARFTIRDNKLAMDSLHIVYEFGTVTMSIDISHPSTMSMNPGLNRVVSMTLSTLIPRVAKEWQPALEKFVALRLDEVLKNLQLDDVLGAVKPKYDCNPSS